jgi:hypothetical protein
MNIIKFVAALFASSAISCSVNAQGQDIKGAKTLDVTVVEGVGSCYVDNVWVPVEGVYIYWEQSGQPLKFHEHNRFTPTDKYFRPIDALAKPLHFRLRIDLEDIKKQFPDEYYLSRSSNNPEIPFTEKLSEALNIDKQTLIPATLVQDIPESQLYRINRYSEIPLSDNYDRIVSVPTRYAACRMTLDYQMNRAKAFFKTTLLGGIEILHDETVPYGDTTKTFAEKVLLR